VLPKNWQGILTTNPKELSASIPCNHDAAPAQ
jgi:hypothetical protein